MLFNDTTDAKRMLREIKILRHLEHKNCVKLYDIILTEDPKTFNNLYLVLEFCTTDLRKLQRSSMTLNELHIKTIMYNLLCGLQHMHSAGVMHRDINPANILVLEDCTVKLCDFGLAR
mmetsp:Transcript_15168/g.10659  ORF Transcript_15168/g.10659 Transcript_15168/m.10659 type:complete len:118 (+) Transcript_15168:235-588(+)